MSDDTYVGRFDRVIGYALDQIEDGGVDFTEVKPWWWDEDIASVNAALSVLDMRPADPLAAVPPEHREALAAFFDTLAQYLANNAWRSLPAVAAALRGGADG